jgi:hypothetical protein
MYQRTEDAFTVEPMSQRELEPGEEIGQIEDGMRRATEKLAAIRQVLSAAETNFPKIPAVNDQLREHLDQADSHLAQTRIRLYNRLQKPREEGVLDAAALDEIGNCFARHVEQSHIPGIEQTMAKICSDFLSSHYRDKAFSQQDQAYRFVQAVCPDAAQDFRNEPRRTGSQRHVSMMGRLPE